MMNVVLFFKLANLVLGTFPTSVWAQDNVFLDAGQNDLSISSHDFNQIFSRYGECMRANLTFAENDVN
jgi:hypothetical protein